MNHVYSFKIDRFEPQDHRSGPSGALNLTDNALALAGGTTSVIPVGGVAPASPPDRALTSGPRRSTIATTSFHPCISVQTFRDLGLLLWLRAAGGRGSSRCGHSVHHRLSRTVAQHRYRIRCGIIHVYATEAAGKMLSFQVGVLASSCSNTYIHIFEPIR